MRHFDKNKAAISLYLWALSVSLLPNIIMLYSERITSETLLCNLLVPVSLYLFALSFCRKTWIGVLVMSPVFFLAAFQLVLFNLYGSSDISVDMWLNIATTNASEVKELLGNLMEAIIIVTVLYLPPMIVAVISFFHKWQISFRSAKSLKKASLFCGCFGALGICLAGFGRNITGVNDVFPLNAIVNLYGATVSQSQMSNYASTSSDFVFNSVCVAHSDERQVHVIVIGETSRAANWSMFGYQRNTTASLDTISGIIGFNKAVTQSNTTHKSVPMLMSHLGGDNFVDSIYIVKGLIAAYKEAGFSTAYFSNQQRNNSYIDFFGEEADTCVFIKDLVPTNEKPKDSILADLAAAELRKGNKRQLVVLHMYGSHFNYVDRYSDNSRIFSPDQYPEANKKYRENLINAYDNSIIETSHVIYDLIGELSDIGCRATLVFVSDHGEDIFDDDRNRFLHASSIPTYYQLHVPFMIWMSSTYCVESPEKVAAARQNSHRIVSSSASLFHTALNLAEIHCRVYDETLSVVSDKYYPHEQGFLNDHNEFVTLDCSGLTSLDVKKFNEAQIPIPIGIDI